MLSVLIISFNSIFTSITGWALGYICVSSSRNKYERWYGTFLYLMILYSCFNLGAGWIFAFIGLISCSITAYFTEHPNLLIDYNDKYMYGNQKYPKK